MSVQDATLVDTLRSMVGGARILMVDDEPINAEVVRLHLAEEGYQQFHAVSDPARALDVFKELNPDIVLLDLMMPGVSGFDILEAIRADEANQTLPVIMLTSSDDPATKLKALKLGVTDFLGKPADPSELALRMRNALVSRIWEWRNTHSDPLTGLANRRLFAKWADQRLGRCRAADDAGEGWALVVIQLRQLSSINDSFGLEVGESVIRLFAGRLADAFAEGRKAVVDGPFDHDCASQACDVVARLGVDRFAAFLRVESGEEGREALENRLREFLSIQDKAAHVDSHRIHIAAAAGVAIALDPGDGIEDLFNHADTALAQALRNRSGGFAIHSAQMARRTRELMSMENGLRSAVDKGEIFLLYQPKVDIADERITGVEALVRWQNPEHGLISPVSFIPMAEDTGTIISIGEWVLRESCRQLVRWHEQGLVDLNLAVNVSVRQLEEPGFIDVVEQALSDSGLASGALTLELTENMIMENAMDNVIKLEALKRLGVRLSIDDFGTGYSSLAYLQRFPLDQLKIDRTFVNEIHGPVSRTPIIRALISLAHQLGLSVVAEGVETHHQLAHLKALRCDEYQGYYCSKPILAEALFDLCRQHPSRAA